MADETLGGQAGDAAIASLAMSNPYTAALYAAYKLGSPIWKANQAAKQQAAEASAYDNYSGDIKTERLQGRSQMQEYYNTGNKNFEREANTALPELGLMTSDIQSKGTEAQQEAMRNADAQNALHGVRGAQAVTGANRATGKITTDMQRQINQMAYDEAANRQNARLGYYNEQAMTPYRSLSNIQWWKPGEQEAAYKGLGIKTKYAQPQQQQ